MRNGLRASSSAAIGRNAVDTTGTADSRRVAQVVEADRVHAERGEDPRDLAQLGRRADPDRAVPFGGDPLDRPSRSARGAVGARRRRRSPRAATSTSVV